MNNRKPATASKRSRSPKPAARSHRTKQSLVRSPKDKPLGAVAPSPTESTLTQHDGSSQEAPIAENQAEDINQMVSGQRPEKGFDFPLATPGMRAFQTKVPQLAQANMQFAQANMQFAFEFVRRIATIRSPFEILSILAEFTSKRIEMFRKFSQEMTELTVKRNG